MCAISTYSTDLMLVLSLKTYSYKILYALYTLFIFVFCNRVLCFKGFCENPILFAKYKWRVYNVSWNGNLAEKKNEIIFLYITLLYNLYSYINFFLRFLHIFLYYLLFTLYYFILLHIFYIVLYFYIIYKSLWNIGRFI